jgi:LPXTG-motif cell wall-anchored protein
MSSFLGSGAKTQVDSTSQAGASEEAQLGQGQAAVSRDESNAQGGFLSTNVAQGAINANSGTITLTDGGAFQLARDLTGQYTTTLSDYLAQQREADTSKDSMLGELVKSFGSLVESKNTAGDSSRNSIILWLGLAGLAVLGLFFLRKRA